LAIDPEWRRKGVARNLMTHLIETCASDNLTEILLEVRVSNTVANNLYRKLGFKEIAITPNYYSDNREDALVMSLQLDRDKSTAL
jgi:ribosomal-protein-alanine N-acetyltransferase